MALVIIIPFLITLPLTYDLILSTAQSLFSQENGLEYHDIPYIIKTFGYIPIALALLGTFWLALKGGVKNYSLVFSLLALLLMLAIFYKFQYGAAMMYLRGLLFMMLMLGTVAGAGLMALRKLELPWVASVESGRPIVIKVASILLCLIVIGVTLATAIPNRQNTRYYHMIDETDYEAFVWIRDNIGDGYEKAILDPWKGTPFTAITEKYVYTKIHVSPANSDVQAYEFLEDGCTDTAFLREKGISIVYTQEPCGNPDLIEVRKYVYLLKEDGE